MQDNRLRLLVLAVLIAIAVMAAIEFRARRVAHEPAPVRRSQGAGASVDEFLATGTESYERARREVDLRRLLPAEEAVGQALLADSVGVDVYVLLGRIRSMENRYEEAAQAFDRAIFYEPLNPRHWGLLGDVFMEQGDYRGADSCYHTMFDLDDGFHSLVRTARNAFELRGINEALDLVDRAIGGARHGDVAPSDLAAAYVLLANILMAQGHWDGAKTEAAAAVAVYPASIEARSLLADIAALQGELERARSGYGQLVVDSPHPMFKSSLARVYRMMGDGRAADSLVSVAAAEYDRLARAFPDRARREQVGFLVEWHLDPERAVRVAYGVSRNRRDVYTYELLALAYYGAGQYDLAWSAIALALRQGPQDPRFFHTAALIAKASGRADKYEIYARKTREANARAAEMYGPF